MGIHDKIQKMDRSELETNINRAEEKFFEVIDKKDIVKQERSSKKIKRKVEPEGHIEEELKNMNKKTESKVKTTEQFIDFIENQFDSES